MTLAMAAAAIVSVVKMAGCSEEPSVDASLAAPAYDRAVFGGWVDEDGDCQNTRHERLAALSTVDPDVSADGRRVVRGRWFDPYTGRTVFEAGDLEVDHVVPLAWAWDRGAWAWSDAKRGRFANDPRNLLPVDASANRARGADGPLNWLPPDERFHCQYLLRFTRVVVAYEFVLKAGEANDLATLVDRTCGEAS